nr:DnaD domain protein [Anaerolineae bacterium]
MKGFSGFPQKGRLIKVPGQFFTDLLPHIDNLAELKVTLYCFWRLHQKEGKVVFLRKDEILADNAFMSGLGPSLEERLDALNDGLERAVARGTLLAVQVQGDQQTIFLYFVNTPRGRAAVEGIEKGNWMPSLTGKTTLEVLVDRPNIYRLYEQNIGPLTPHIADTLRDFEETYPIEWIEEAIKAAVENNVLRLSYIQAILKEWAAKGRPTSAEEDSQRYISGKYSNEIEH